MISGQEVFYRMRSYGASIADMALLLVAADDGVPELDIVYIEYL